MTSPVAKGRSAELRAQRYLEAQGYTVHRTLRNAAKTPWGVFSNGNDIFGCADLIAKRRGERCRYIQVTMDTHIGPKKQALETVPWDDHLESVEIWRWVGGKNRGKHPTTGQAKPTMYFEVYRRENAYKPDKDKRIFVRGAGTAEPQTPAATSTPAWPTSTSPSG